MLDASAKDKVRKQVEFYFSDSNLPRDNFLRDKVEENPDGFVDVALLCIFARMQQLLKNSHKEVSKVPDELIEAVAEALEPSEELVLSDNKRRVRRAHALDAPAEEVAQAVDERSLYASPFPFDTSLDTLVDFFKQQGEAKCVRMRRHVSSKDFKGSVFVEFASPEEADRVRQLELVFAGAPLNMEAKTAYLVRKQEQRHARPNSPYNPASAAKAHKAKGKRKAEAEAEAEEDAEGEQQQGGGEEAEEPQYDPGCVVHFTFGDQEFVEAPTYFLVRDSFGGNEAGVKYVDYESGAREGNARFGSAEQAQAALEAAGEEGGPMVAGYPVTLRALEGEEEVAYMKSVAAQRAKAVRVERTTGSRGGRGGRGGGRGGRRGFRSRGGGRGKRGRY